MNCSILKWLDSKVWLRFLRFKITRLVPSSFDFKNITIPFLRSLFTFDIICRQFWPLFIPTLSIEGSSKTSSLNSFTISGSYVIFAHSYSLVEIQTPLKWWSFCCNHCFSSDRNCSKKLTLSKHVFSFSWICFSSVSKSWQFSSSVDSLIKSLQWRNNWRELLHHTGANKPALYENPDYLCLRVDLLLGRFWAI